MTAVGPGRPPDWSPMSPRVPDPARRRRPRSSSRARAADGGAGVEPVARAATGTDPAGDGPLDSTPETVAMIGDSITFMSTEPLQAALAATGLEVLAIDAQVGRRITVGEGAGPIPAPTIVEFIANSEPPDVWVIALGTNDIGQYADAGEFAAQVQTLLDLLPAAAPLVWIDTWDGDQPRRDPPRQRHAPLGRRRARQRRRRRLGESRRRRRCRHRRCGPPDGGRHPRVRSGRRRRRRSVAGDAVIATDAPGQRRARSVVTYAA